MAVDTLSPIPTSPLSFPARTYAKLSPHAFLRANLASPQNTRPSGRTPSQARRIICNTSSLSHTAGSAVFRLGDTAAVCGIRAEILLVDDIADYQQREDISTEDPSRLPEEERRKRRKDDADEIGRLHLLVPNVELATGCSPGHLPGGPPSDVAQTLSQRILTLLHVSQLVDLHQLRIWYHPPSTHSPDDMDVCTGDDGGGSGETAKTKAEIKAFWTLYIDILFLSLDGNPFDAAWGSLMAAFKDLRLPSAQWNSDLEMVLCNGDATNSAQILQNRDLPVPLSFGVFMEENGTEGARQKWLLVDMDGFEEGVCREGGTVVVKGRRKEMLEIVRIEKSGGGAIGPGDIRELVRLATEKWVEWDNVLRRLL
jgi:exosome complex component RRP43